MSRRRATKVKKEPTLGVILQLKVRLIDVSPMVWRRVLVPAAYTLQELHGTVQVAMGWEAIYLYQFKIRAVHYGSYHLGASSPQESIEHFRFRKGSKFIYKYDMGDLWQHEIRVEDGFDLQPGQPYPICTDGGHACPPESCGGPAAYVERRQEALGGFEAMDDLDTLSRLINPIVLENNIGLLDDPEVLWELERAINRTKTRERFLAETFSLHAVNARFLQDDHHVLMHQQL